MKLLNDLKHVASEINPAIHFCYFPKEIVDVGRKAYIHMQYNVMYNPHLEYIVVTESWIPIYSSCSELPISEVDHLELYRWNNSLTDFPQDPIWPGLAKPQNQN